MHPAHLRPMNFLEWLLLVLLSTLWGSSFVFNEIVLTQIPPLTVVLGRAVLASIALSLIMRISGHRLPRVWRWWLDIAIMALVSILIPFNLILWGQRQIDSALASILVATMPLLTVALAHFLTSNERLTVNKAAGVLLGLAGVTFILGPDALGGLGAQVSGQLACLAATLLYAYSGIFGRRFRKVPPLVVTTGQVVATSVMLAPIALVVDRPWSLPMPALGTWGALLSLGLLSTAAAYLIYFRLLASAGATNIALVTFLSPVTTTILGMLILGENPDPRHLLGLGLIASGLAAIDGRLLARLKPHGRGEAPVLVRPRERGREL